MREAFGSNVRFVLMNSFSTSADTLEHLSGTHPDLVAEDGWELLQNKSPKVDAATMDPVEFPENTDMEWYALLLHRLLAISVSECSLCALWCHRQGCRA